MFDLLPCWWAYFTSKWKDILQTWKLMWTLKCWEKEQPYLETGIELLLMTVLCFKWRFIIFSVVVERYLPWALSHLFLCNAAARGRQELPLGGNCLVTMTFGYWVNVLGILLQSCYTDIQLHSWKRKSPFLSHDKLLWNECSHKS